MRIESDPSGPRLTVLDGGRRLSPQRRGRRRPPYKPARSLPADLVSFYFERLASPTRVLDVGCGRGDLGQHRPGSVEVLCGVDVDSDSFMRARGYDRLQAIDLERDELPFADHSFDAVVAKDVLEHVQRPWEVLDEINRVLEPRGRLLVSVPLPKASVVWGDYTHVRGFTPASLCELLEDCGFVVRATWKMGGIPLTGRYELIRWVPTMLAVPPIGALFASSVEALATVAP
jgi:SAM-dependent methyltransferase